MEREKECQYTYLNLLTKFPHLHDSENAKDYFCELIWAYKNCPHHKYVLTEIVDKLTEEEKIGKELIEKIVNGLSTTFIEDNTITFFRSHYYHYYNQKIRNLLSFRNTIKYWCIIRPKDFFTYYGILRK